MQQSKFEVAKTLHKAAFELDNAKQDWSDVDQSWFDEFVAKTYGVADSLAGNRADELPKFTCESSEGCHGGPGWEKI
ncbi:MAG: hypothetical protein PHD37_17670 [Gallionellaceae bacterium]|nr:hypothetical protein [Gallionellaceae bacterium]